MCSVSFTEISTWRVSSQHWRAMSSLSWKGASSRPSPVSKSQQVRPAPSRAWISPTKMLCINWRDASGASGSVALKAFLCERSSRTALRGSKTTSSMLMRWNRVSRASSSTGRILFIERRPPLGCLIEAYSDGVDDLFACQAGAGRRRQGAVALELRYRRHRMRIGEDPRVGEVSGPAGDVDGPPRRLEGDAVRVGEVDRADDVVV